jgi:hypothetical protein
MAPASEAEETDMTIAPGAVPAKRPAIMSNRWQEDWSALANPALRTQPFDVLKYIPLGDRSAELRVAPRSQCAAARDA